MQLKNLIADEDAVSPVIGVILMVAITVILAAVIGTFVLGLGDQVSSSAPQASFTFDFGDGVTGISNACTFTATSTVNVTHDGGDSITAEKLDLSVGGTTNGWESCSSANAGDDISSGSEAHAEIANDDTLRVVWTSSGGDSTQTLAKFEGPDA